MPQLFNQLYKNSMAQTKVAYSSTPSASVSVTRLLNGSAPFRHQAIYAEPERKVIICTIDLSSTSKAIKALHRMLKIMKFDIKYTKDIPGIKPHTLSSKEASQALGYSLDEIYLLNEQSASKLVEDNNNYWRNACLSDITLTENPISQYAFKSLLKSSAKTVKRLFVNNFKCPLIKFIPYDLLGQCNELEELSLSNCNNLNEGMLNALNLKSLKKLGLGCLTISTASLNIILAQCESLEELSLSNCNNLSKGTLSALNLKSLKKLDLSSSNISTTSLNTILAQCESLEELNLSGCINHSEGMLSALCQLQLKIDTKYRKAAIEN